VSKVKAIITKGMTKDRVKARLTKSGEVEKTIKGKIGEGAIEWLK
jgi:hypothetical protein